MQRNWFRSLCSAALCVLALGRCTSQPAATPAATLEITPHGAVLGIGATQAFTARSPVQDAGTDLTTEVTWTSSDPSIATIDASGVATAVAAGQATIVATLGALMASATVNVTDASLQTITISPATPSVTVGMTRRFSAVGTYSDGSTADLSGENSLSWSSERAEVASIDPNGLATAKQPGATTISASLDGVSGSTTFTVTDAALKGFALEPSGVTLPQGEQRSLRALGVFSDGTTQDLSADASWSSDDSSIADVSQGTVTGKTPGATSVRASWREHSASASVVVTAAVLKSIVITPPAPSLARGGELVLTAVGVFSDGSSEDVSSTVLWTSSDLEVASVSNAAGSKGKLTALTSGQVTIGASRGDVSASVELSVSDAELSALRVTAARSSFALGTDLQLTATGVYTDGGSRELTGEVHWLSSDGDLVGVDDRGLAHANATGTASVTAQLGSITGKLSLTVNDAVLTRLTIASADTGSLPLGATRAFGALGEFTDGSTHDLTSDVLWVSSDPEVAVIDNAGGSQGRVRAMRAGSTTITAARSGSVSPPITLEVTAALLTEVRVTPAAASRPQGLPVSFVATGLYTDDSQRDITQEVSWTSSDPEVAPISSAGLASTLAQGTATITALDPATGESGTASLAITSALLEQLLITPADAQIAVGTQQQLTAIGVFSDGSSQTLTSAVSWSSSDPARVTISSGAGFAGLATGVAAGKVEIRARYGSVLGTTPLTVSSARLASLAVDPASDSVPKGLHAAFTAVGYFSDLTQQDLTAQVSWSSDAPGVASVSNAVGSEGVASSLGVGIAHISATLLGQVGSASLSVTDQRVVSLLLTEAKDAVQKPKGATAHYSALATYTDGSQGDVTDEASWSSSDPGVLAACDPQPGPDHCFEARDLGRARVTASIDGLSGPVSASRELEVTAAELVALAVDPPVLSLAKGLSRQLKATGTYTDGSAQDLTDQVDWTASDHAIAQLDVAPRGQLTAAAVGGPVTITARLGDTTASASLTVTGAILRSIGVTPSPAAVAKGLSLQLTATGVYSDGATADLTDAAAWDTDDHAIALVSSLANGAGEVTALAVGPVVVSAHYQSITGTASLSVTGAVLQRIQVTSAHASVAKGTTEQFAAIGLYSDGSNQDLTSQVSWTSASPEVATIGLHDGFVQSRQTGTTRITAALDAISGSRDLTVNAAELVSLQVGRSSPGSVPKGVNAQFTATGVYTDASQQDLTESATWSSGDPGVVSVSNVDGQRGAATTLAVGGPVVITASMPGPISATSSLTVTAAVPTSLRLSPVSPSIANGTTLRLSATASYSDGSTAVVTTTSTWSSGSPAVALVSNADGSRGLASSVSVGTSQITASFAGFTASTGLTVTSATLQNIAVTPAAPSSALGFTRRFTATGTYTDGSTQDLTGSVTWTSSDEGVALISNDAGTKGLASTVAAGSATIRATLGAVRGQTAFTVTSAALQRIELAPADASVVCSACQDLVATGYFSDGSNAPITGAVTFTSDDQRVVSVSDGDPGPGQRFQLCSGSLSGTTIITATDPASNVTGSTSASNAAACP